MLSAFVVMAEVQGAPGPLTVSVDDFGTGLFSGRLKQVCPWQQACCSDNFSCHSTAPRGELVPIAVLLQEVEARVPLRNVLFSLSRAVVSVEEFPIR